MLTSQENDAETQFFLQYQDRQISNNAIASRHSLFLARFFFVKIKRRHRMRHRHRNRQRYLRRQWHLGTAGIRRQDRSS